MVMRITLSFLALLLLLVDVQTRAQTTQPVEDFKPSSLNQAGKQYPQVNSEDRARFRVVAPQAQSVRSSFSGPTLVVRSDDGAWILPTRPLDEGFHYYTLNIDGADVPDPGTLFFYGAGRWGSAVEVPAKDQVFFNSRMSLTASCGRTCTSPTAQMPCAAASSTRRRITIKIRLSVTPCSTCNRAPARMRRAGETRATRA
jgi:hypothetical protein